MKAVHEEQEQLVAAMCGEMPDPDRAREVWHHLRNCKDQRVAKLLALLSSPTCTYAEATTALGDIRSRTSQRLVPGQLSVLREICVRSCSAVLLCKNSTARLLQRISLELETGTAAEVANRDCADLELIVEYATIFPEVLTDAAPVLAQAVQHAHEQQGSTMGRRVLVLLLRTAQAASVLLSCASPSTRKAIVSVLCQNCCGKDAGVGKLAAQVLSTKLLVRPR